MILASMLRLVRLAPVVLLVLAATAASAHAGALGLIVAGEPAKQPVIETTLEPWLESRGYDVQLRVADPKVADKLVDCFIITDQRCGEAAVAKLGLASTLFVMVEVHHDTATNSDEVKLTGWLYGDQGLAIASQSVFCRSCKNDTLGPTVEDLAQSLFAVAGEGTGRVRIVSSPAGAAVLIDGARVGATPWEQGLRAGPHTVTVELARHQSHTAQIDVKKDAVAEVDVALVSYVTTPTAGRAKWPLALAGVGAALAVTGVVLIALDEDVADAGTTEATYFDSATGGVALLGAGLVAAGAGTFLYLRSGKPAATTPTAWIDPGRGGGVGLVGRF